MTEIRTADHDTITVDTYQAQWIETNWGTRQSHGGAESHVSCSIDRLSVNATESMLLRLTPQEARHLAAALVAAAQTLELTVSKQITALPPTP